MLVFCKDHILRYKVWQYDNENKRGRYLLLPFRSYEKYFEDAFYKRLRDNFELQEGITVKDLFLNLEPWANAMEGIACMDFQAFCDEAKKEPEPDEDLDYLVIKAHITFSVVPEYERHHGESMKDLFFNSKAVVTNRFDMEQVWGSSVMLKKEAVKKYDSESISCDYSPLSEWGHCPVYIDRTAKVMDTSLVSRKIGHSSFDEPLLNPKHPLVSGIEGYDGKVNAHQFPIEVTPTFYETLVNGCFWEWGFHYSPVGRDMSREDIQKSLNEVSEIIEEDAPEESLSAEENSKEVYGDTSYTSSMDREIQHKKKIYDKIINSDNDCIIEDYVNT